MLTFYLAPFALLSLAGFVVCEFIPPLNRYTLSALLGPFAFALGSIVGWIAFVWVTETLFGIRLGPATGIHGWIEEIFFSVLPGILGSWLAISGGTKLERRSFGGVRNGRPTR